MQHLSPYPFHSPKISGTCTSRCPFLYRQCQKPHAHRPPAALSHEDGPAPKLQQLRKSKGGGVKRAGAEARTSEHDRPIFMSAGPNGSHARCGEQDLGFAEGRKKRSIDYFTKSLHNNSACSRTVSVARSCLSGGYPYFRRILLIIIRNFALTDSRTVQSIETFCLTV